MKYIFISHLPGAAGNFFARCLNLMSGAYCFGYNNILPETLEQKLDMLSYQSVVNRTVDSDSWSEFEKKLTPHHILEDHYTLPANAYSIWLTHPRSTKIDIAGPDDQVFDFYIDPTNRFEWVLMNALYKNSYLDVDWFKNGKKLLDDLSIHKISLDNVLKDWNHFQVEFKKVTDIIEYDTSDSEIQAVKTLYEQWKTTTLKSEDIENFKQHIGFFM